LPTSCKPLGGQWFRGLVGVGADLPEHRSAEQLPVSAHQSSCQAAVRGAATHRPDQAASHHHRAVGGASASRNRRFESVPLQQRVCKLSVPRALRLRWRNQIHCTRVREVRIQFPPAASQMNSHPNRRGPPLDLEVVRYWDLAAATERTKLNDRTRRSAPSTPATRTVANPGAGWHLWS